MGRSGKTIAPALLVFIGLLLYMKCIAPNSGTATETGNVTSMLYNPGGSPAVHATVRVCKHDNDPRPGHDSGVVASTTTDANGNYSISLDAGIYTVTATGDSGLAYQDSVSAIKGDTVRPDPDTLKPAGSIRGVVQLQPGDDPRTIFILFMGTRTFTWPDDSLGNFTSGNMAAGKYRVRILTTTPDYEVMDTSFRIVPGIDSILTDTIRLKYKGIPTPKNLIASFDTLNETVVLSWDMPDTSLLSGYNVYRSIKGQNFSLVTQTPLPKMRTSYHDTGLAIGTVYEYRVVSRTQAGVESKMVDMVADTALVVSSALVTTTFSWSTTNTIHDTASIKDTVKICVIYSNPTRKIKRLEWYLDTTQTPRQTKIDSSLLGKDSVVYYCPAQAGLRQFILKATDAANTVWRDTIGLGVVLDVPVANGGNDTIVSINDSFTIHGSGTDRFGRIVKYRFDANEDGIFEDSSITAIVKRLKASSVPGDYNVVLQVEDDDGNKTNDSMVVHVILDPPVAEAGVDAAVSKNDTVRLHGSATQRFGTIVKWELNIGNGGFKQTSTGDTTITTPDSIISPYQCVLRVTDDDGNISAPDTVNLFVGCSLPAFGWIQMAPLLIGQEGLTTQTVNGKIYAIGGWNDSLYSTLDVVEEYNSITNSWQIKSPMKNKRYLPASVVIDSLIFVIGGCNQTILNSMEIYSPATDSWVDGPPMPTARYSATASVANGKIYVFGGYNGADVNNVEEYDPLTKNWTEKGPMPKALDGPSSQSIGNKIFLFGGDTTGAYVPFKLLWEYDPVADTWSSKTPMNTPRNTLASCVINSQIYAIGGDGCKGCCIDVVEVYNLASDSWNIIDPLPFPTYRLSAATINNHIFVVGGRTSNGIENNNLKY
jgi:N-acetylneuraminic acid mutarotase